MAALRSAQTTQTLSSLSLSQNVYIQRREGRDRRGQTSSFCPAELHLQDKKPSSHKLSYAAVLTLTKEKTLTFLPSWNTMDAHLKLGLHWGKTATQTHLCSCVMRPSPPIQSVKWGKKEKPTCFPSKLIMLHSFRKVSTCSSYCIASWVFHA